MDYEMLATESSRTFEFRLDDGTSRNSQPKERGRDC